MLCTACRSELPPGARFCGVCGFRLESAPAYPPSPLPATSAPGPGSATAPAAVHQARRIDTHVPPAAQVAAVAELRAVPVSVPAEAPRPRPRTAELVLKPGGEQRTKTVEITRASVDSALREAGRRQGRFALSVEVTLASEHNFYQGFAENISEGGIFVATNDIHAVGTQFDMTFTLPELGRSCTALCEVRWTRDYNSAPDLTPGMGLAFLRLTPSDVKAVEIFLHHREPIFFDSDG